MSLWEYLGAGSWITKGLYRLNGDANDSSGNWNNGTATNVTWVPGRLGSQCASGSSTSKKIDCWDNFEVTSWDATWSLWIRHDDAVGNNTTLFAKFTNAELKGYYVNYPSWVLAFVSWDGSATTIWVWSFAPTVWVWYHYCFVKSGTNIKIYVNANKEWDGTIPDPGSPTSKDTFRWMNWASAAETLSPNCSMDEAIFEPRAWTASEVRKYYTYASGQFAIL